MKSAKKLFAAATFAAVASFSVSANASVFVIDYTDDGVWNAYDSQNQTYSMRFRSDQGNDGFWLVVTDGDNPNGTGGNHAVLYGDIANNRITAYSYDGQNNSGSFNTGTLLGTYDGAFSESGTHAQFGYELTEFTLDVSDLNDALGPDFDGVQLGPEAGIWFHQTADSNFSYDADGAITDYAFSSQSFLDSGNDVTRHRDRDQICSRNSQHYWCQEGTELAGGSVATGNGAQNGVPSGGGSVPAPGGLALILVGLACVGRKYFKKA